MDSPIIPDLPFIVREMLRFGKTANLSLRLTTQAIGTRTIIVRVLTRDGFSEFSQAYTGTGAAQSVNFALQDIPIFVSVVSETSTVNQGEIYCTLSLRFSDDIVYQLASGFVYRQRGISWPYTGNADIIPNRGGIRFVQGSNAAAGSEVSDTVPSGQLWKILSVRFTLVTDANAANRRVHLVTDNNSFPGVDVFGDVNQAANTTRNYTFYNIGSIPDRESDDDILVNLPADLYVLGSGSIITQTESLQAGDNFGVVTYCIEQLYMEEL